MKKLVNRILGLFGVMVVRSATLRRLKAELSALKRQLDDARQREKLLEASGLTQQSSDFADASTATTADATPNVSLPRLAHQHSVFHRFTPWEGLVGPAFDPTPYGSLIRRAFHDQPPHASERTVHCDHPSLNEEYYEWIDLLEAISAARGKFTMVELGAGYGRWVVAAAAILRRHAPVPYHFVAVEAESAHFAMLRQHFLDNGLDPHQHCLIHAAVSDKHGEVHFTEGHPGEWYGQSILQDPSANFGNWEKARVVKVPSVPLTSILEKLDYVDLLDMDIQGHEAIVCAAAQDSLNKKVQRVHIGTHSPEIERELEVVFGKMGWKCYQNYPCNTHTRTPYGVTSFEDGVQSWINPKIRNPADLTRSSDAQRLEPPQLAFVAQNCTESERSIW